MNGDDGVNRWCEEDAFDAWEDEDEVDEETKKEELARAGFNSEEELDAEIRDLMFRFYLTSEEQSKVDLKDPKSVESALVLAHQREADHKNGLPLPPDTIAYRAPDDPRPPSVGNAESQADRDRIDRESSDSPDFLNLVPRCQHIKADNRQCGSPALRGRRYCFFHDRTADGRKRKGPIQVPVLEDSRSIQMALTRVCRGVIDGSLDPKRGTTLLYGLQVAATAIKPPARKAKR